MKIASDICALHRSLEKLLHGPAVMSGSKRTLVQAGDADILEAMRVELFETQFPRLVTFRNNRGTELTVEVASSRLIAVCHPTSNELLKDYQEIALPKRVSTTDGDMTLLRNGLTLFASGATGLTVETRWQECGSSAFDVGLSTDEVFLMQSSSSAQQSTEASDDVLRDFLDSSQGISSAGLLLSEGRVELEYGSDAMLSALKALIQAENDERVHSQFADANQSAACQCVIYSGHPDDDNSVICMSKSNELGFVYFGNDAFEAVLDIWQSLSAQ